MRKGLSEEAHRVLNYFARTPKGHTNVPTSVAKELLLYTDSHVISLGTLYNLKARDIGAGVYQLTLEELNHG
jgi:hypothetical protein